MNTILNCDSSISFVGSQKFKKIKISESEYKTILIPTKLYIQPYLQLNCIKHEAKNTLINKLYLQYATEIL